ncbi:hypothetical protein AMAG_03422 [Allomyces macrogynus ATCC 38327]|uniref:Uncharacterized protein n=1 Tax=Allomyces macrogynus (strain ATCC 38327) TaxID=578462 RepID=A0A0L0S9K5_ALLM3|nr:hypothetical protein AMAG_03422 [Allomyces macrogynus ATCC 38327]|eukprot:KNE59075.1 hypothetical protein AMAG_03422 [Allomyces macrogynus ATCC 38327]
MQPVFLRVVGPTLGERAARVSWQDAIALAVVFDAVARSFCSRGQLACVDMAWIVMPTNDEWRGTVTTRGGANVAVRVSRDNPATVLPDPYRGMCLLMVVYWTDANACPGTNRIVFQE